MLAGNETAARPATNMGGHMTRWRSAMVKNIVNLLIGLLVPTLLVVKLSRLLFDVQIRWLYIVAAAVFVVGSVVLVMRSRAPETGAQ
jgi:predicted permease